MNLTLTTLKKRDDLRAKTNKLIESSFMYSPTNNYSSDFYPLMNEKNAHQNFIIIDKDSDSVVGHIGAVVRNLGNRDTYCKTLLLGGIAIESSYREQGIFKIFFPKILTQFENLVSLYMLFTDQLNLYKKFGFFPAGNHIQTGTDKLYELDDFVKTSLLEISKEDFLSIKQIYKNYVEKNCTTIIRDDDDWETLKGIDSTDLYIKKNNDKIVGYFFINKGFDLGHIIHEFAYLKGYKESVLTPLLKYKLWLSNPNIEKIKTSNTHYTCLMRLGNSNLFETYFNQTYKNISITKITNKYIKYIHDSSKYKSSFEYFLENVWGGPDSHKEVSPLYISGLDSV